MEPPSYANRLGVCNLLQKCAICTIIAPCMLHTSTVNNVHPSGMVLLGVSTNVEMSHSNPLVCKLLSLTKWQPCTYRCRGKYLESRRIKGVASLSLVRCQKYRNTLHNNSTPQSSQVGCIVYTLYTSPLFDPNLWYSGKSVNPA